MPSAAWTDVISIPSYCSFPNLLRAESKSEIVPDTALPNCCVENWSDPLFLPGVYFRRRMSVSAQRIPSMAADMIPPA